MTACAGIALPAAGRCTPWGKYNCLATRTAGVTPRRTALNGQPSAWTITNGQRTTMPQLLPVRRNAASRSAPGPHHLTGEIGRASCRERGLSVEESDLVIIK